MPKIPSRKFPKRSASSTAPAQGGKRSRSKYGAKITKLDGITFHSQAEARRYTQLKLLERAGEIQDITLQPRFRCDVNGQKIADVVLDFSYFDHSKRAVVFEDVKGMDNPMSKIKRKLVEAIHGIEVVIVK